MSEELPQLKADLLDIMETAMASGHQIYFLDEVTFTSKTLQRREFSAKGHNINVDQAKLFKGYWCVIAAISFDYKVEHLYFNPGAINMILFNEFLSQLYKKAGKKKAFLFMDQLNVHSGKDVMPTYEKLNFVPIWNIKYSPDYNPIETVFAQVKLWYKRERLNLLANGKEIDTKALIRRAFK